MTPAREITATSVVPPPMSTIKLPPGSSIGSPAPIAAATAPSDTAPEQCSAQRLRTVRLPDTSPIYHVPRGGSRPAKTAALASDRDVELGLEGVTVRRQFRELLSRLHIQPAQRSGGSV